MIDLTFEAYSDPDDYKEIILDFFPEFGDVGHFGLKMVN